MSQPFPPPYPEQRLTPPGKPEKPGKTGLITLIVLVALIFSLVVFLNESMLKIKKVAIMGIQHVTWAEAIVAAGLDRPVSYFSVNEQKIAQGLQSNRYLVFERLEKQFPDGLTIYVRERKPTVRVQEMGAEYVLDADGMVLERAERLNSGEYSGLMMLTGMKPKDMRVGRVMAAGSARTMEAYRALIAEIQLQGIADQISELNVSDPENLYLTTLDGYIAHLGGPEQLRAKVGTVRAVISYLRNEGRPGGMLEANIPGEAVYTPLSP